MRRKTLEFLLLLRFFVIIVKKLSQVFCSVNFTKSRKYYSFNIIDLPFEYVYSVSPYQEIYNKDKTSKL